jgi:hypothetical protein
MTVDAGPIRVDTQCLGICGMVLLDGVLGSFLNAGEWGYPPR